MRFPFSSVLGRSVVLFVAVAGCLESAAPPDDTSDPSEPAALGPVWKQAADLPVPRTEIACTASQGKIFAIGGFTSGALVSRQLDIYDASKDVWTQGADVPLALHHTALVAHKGAIYAFGGYAGFPSFHGLATILKYDPSANSWSVHGSLPERRAAHAAVVVGEEVYLIGGASDQPGGTVYASTAIYNFTTGQWREGPSLITSREHHAAGYAEGVIVAAGGRKLNAQNLDAAEVLAPSQAKWSEAPRLLTARSGIAAASWGSEVVFFGGERPGGTFAEAEAYDVLQRSWRAHPPMPTPRHGLCAVTLMDGIHVIGGFSGANLAGAGDKGFHDVLAWPAPKDV